MLKFVKFEFSDLIEALYYTKRGSQVLGYVSEFYYSDLLPDG